MKPETELVNVLLTNDTRAKNGRSFAITYADHQANFQRMVKLIVTRKDLFFKTDGSTGQHTYLLTPVGMDEREKLKAPVSLLETVRGEIEDR